MKIKNLILVSTLILISAWSCGDKKSKTEKQDEHLIEIALNIANYSNDYIVATCNEQVDTVKVGEDGKYLYSTFLGQDSYLEIKIGRKRVLIYTKPKAEMQIEVDVQDFHNSLKFSGDYAEINNYLAKQSKLLFDAKPASENFIYAGDYSTFSNSFKKYDDESKNNLNKFVEANPNFEDFVILEKERQKLINTILYLSYYSPLVYTEQSDEALENEINSLINSTDKNNPKLLCLKIFYEYAETLIPYKLNLKYREAGIENIDDAEYINDYFDLIGELFSESEVYEAVFYSGLKSFIMYYGTESVSEQFSKYEDFSMNREHLSELNKIFAEYDKLKPGKPSIDWEFPDKVGKIYSSKDFAGKYIYIDVWASWCGPCVRESKFYKEIATKFKGKNIAFVSISVDENKDEWTNFIGNENNNIVNLWAGGWNNDLCNFFKINSIPRFILIDKNGLIINANASNPSGDIEEVLNNLDL